MTADPPTPRDAMTSPIERLIGGSTCRVFSPDVAYHAWPVVTKRGTLCKCGKLRIAQIRQDGEIVAEDVPAGDRATPKEQP